MSGQCENCPPSKGGAGAGQVLELVSGGGLPETPAAVRSVGSVAPVAVGCCEPDRHRAVSWLSPGLVATVGRQAGAAEHDDVAVGHEIDQGVQVWAQAVTSLRVWVVWAEPCGALGVARSGADVKPEAELAVQFVKSTVGSPSHRRWS